MRRVCLLVPVSASPGLTPRTGCCDSGARVTRPTCEGSFGMSPAPPTALSSTYPLWQNDVDDLLHFPSTSYFDILLAPSVPSLPDRTACHGKSFLLRGPAPPTSSLAAFPLRPLLPRATVYHHRILQSIERPYRRMYAPSRRWPGANSVGSPTPTP